MLIKSVVYEEQKRNTEMIETYRSELKNLTKGNLSIKKIGNNEYYYLKYRNDKKIITDYIGKDKEKIEQIEEQIKRRKHYKDMLSALMKEQKIISKILEGLQ
jgi:hypothetical protein